MFQVHILAAPVINYALTQWAHGAPPRQLHLQRVTTTHMQSLCVRNPWVHHQDLQNLQDILKATWQHQRPVSWVCSRRNSKVSQKVSLSLAVLVDRHIQFVAVGALRSGQPPKNLGGHHVEAADEHMSQLLQNARIGFCMHHLVCATMQS